MGRSQHITGRIQRTTVGLCLLRERERFMVQTMCTWEEKRALILGPSLPRLTFVGLLSDAVGLTGAVEPTAQSKNIDASILL